MDWSCALLKSGSDPSQTKLTSFFHVIEKINELTNTEPKFKAVIQASEEQHRKIWTTNTSAFIIQLLKMQSIMLRNFQNAGGEFATSLFIYAGPLAYNFFHNNLPEALPCLCTIQKNLHREHILFKKVSFNLMLS